MMRLLATLVLFAALIVPLAPIAPASAATSLEKQSYIVVLRDDVADRFEAEFRTAIGEIKAHPRRFPFYHSQRRYRRHSLRTFPHLVLYIESPDSIRIMVVKHVKRNPSLGQRRR